MMKKTFIITLLLGLFSLSNVHSAEYIHTSDSQKIIGKLPQSWNYLDGVTSNGNFRQLALRKTSLMLSEGFREITVDNSAAFNPNFQTAGSWVVTVFADHAEKTRTVTNKSLNAVKKAKGRLIRQEGFAILNAKYTDNMEDGYDADFATLKAYYKDTIVPLVTGMSTVQEVIDTNNGDEYTWPAL